MLEKSFEAFQAFRWIFELETRKIHELLLKKENISFAKLSEHSSSNLQNAETFQLQ